MELMFENLRKKLDSQPPRPLVILGWTWIFLIFILAAGALAIANNNNKLQQPRLALGENNTPPPPSVYAVIVTSSASPGSEVIIRGGKFGSKGQVCFRFSQEEPSACLHQFEVLVWTSGSIRARIPQLEKGEGKIWVVMGEGVKSNEVGFTIE